MSETCGCVVTWFNTGRKQREMDYVEYGDIGATLPTGKIIEVIDAGIDHSACKYPAQEAERQAERDIYLRDFAKMEARIAELEKALADAPHADNCRSFTVSAYSGYRSCDCYRSALKKPVA